MIVSLCNNLVRQVLSSFPREKCEVLMKALSNVQSLDRNSGSQISSSGYKACATTSGTFYFLDYDSKVR